MIPDLFVRMEVTEVRFDMGKNMCIISLTF